MYLFYTMSVRCVKQLLPFMRIGGKSQYALPTLVRCQTDASCRRGNTWIASLVFRPDGTRSESLKKLYSVNDATEAEWAGVAMGLTNCMEENYRVIGIESDNLSVISQLIFHDTVLRRDYARYYRGKIYELAAQTEWTGVRWIPRELNLADGILRRGV